MYRYAEHQDNSRTCFLIILSMISDLPPDHIRVLRDCPNTCSYDDWFRSISILGTWISGISNLFEISEQLKNAFSGNRTLMQLREK